MAWDHATGGFNFYRTTGETQAWVFAGNSRHALVDPTQGNGPFESHPSGSLLMKELRAPWSNWDSPDAPIADSVFSPDDPLRMHPWFTQREALGAVDCERHVARPNIERWARSRFEAMAQAGRVDDPRRILAQVVTSPAINLVSSFQTSVGTSSPIDLPATFFVDSEALVNGLGIGSQPSFSVDRSIYEATVDRFDVRLTDGSGFSRRGETHFAFLVPERAFEDQCVVVEARRIGLLTDRLTACLLMTDFSNPVFSSRRAALLRHCPDAAELAGGTSDFSARMADSILSVASGADSGSPEAEFAERWAVGDDWKLRFHDDLLRPYYAAIAQRLESEDAFNAIYELAESQRDRVRQMPIFEIPLLFSESDVDSRPREMRPDGSVAVAG